MRGIRPIAQAVGLRRVCGPVGLRGGGIGAPGFESTAQSCLWRVFVLYRASGKM